MSQTQRAPDPVDLGSTADEESTLGRTEIYDVLSNERRTMVLERLRESEPRELSTLAEEIAAEETGERPPPRKKRTSVYVTLHQSHLPKLEKLGIVEYDDREKVVSLGERAHRVLAECATPTGESSGEPASPWTARYLATVVAGLGLAGGSQVGVPVVAQVSAGAYAVSALVVLLAVLAYRVGGDRARTAVSDQERTE